MLGSFLNAGLALPQAGPVPPAGTEPVVQITDEAAIIPALDEELRVESLVGEDSPVAQGQPVLRLRAAPEIVLVAPMAGRVARIDLRPGRRLTQLVLFHDPEGERHAFDTGTAGAGGLRALLQGSGLWRAFRSRPFGRMPGAGEVPAAIFVMGADSRPNAPAPPLALRGREEEFARGLTALAGLSPAQLFFCEPKSAPYAGPVPPEVKRLRAGTVHPQGLAGMLIHRHFPARVEAPVWDVMAEDVADLGALLGTGYLPQTRLVAVTGDALREARLVRCQPGADLRGLSQSLVKPGPHEVLSGSLLDGQQAHWLGPRDRQVSVLARAARPPARHWFGAALDRAARRAPIIPTAAFEQALGGGAIPAAALVRALASGDMEGFVRLGGLSFVEEDIALADYITGARPRLANQLRAILDRIAAEEDAT